jgi:hypothetical protein
MVIYSGDIPEVLPVFWPAMSDHSARTCSPGPSLIASRPRVLSRRRTLVMVSRHRLHSFPSPRLRFLPFGSTIRCSRNFSRSALR